MSRAARDGLSISVDLLSFQGYALLMPSVGSPLAIVVGLGKTMTLTVGNCRDWQVCTWASPVGKMPSADSRSRNGTAPFCPS